MKVQASDEFSDGRIRVHDGDHHWFFFLCDKDNHCKADCSVCQPPYYTASIKNSKNYKDKDLNNLELDEKDFEKLYFDDDCFDYWEREKIWNCRTNEWEVENVETSDN